MNSDDASGMSLSTQATSGTTAKAVLAVVGFLGGIYFARTLGTAAFGGVYLILSLAHSLDRPIDGVARAAKQRIAGTEIPRGELLGMQMVATAVWLAVLGGALVAVERWVISYTGIGVAIPFLIAILATETVFAGIRPLVQGHGRVSASLWVEAGVKVFAVGIQVLLIWLGFGTTGWVAGIVLANVIGLVPLLWLLNARPMWPSRRTAAELWQFAKYSIPTAFSGKFYTRLDMFLIAAVLTPTVAGYYEAAFKLTFGAAMLGTVVGSTLMPKVGALAADGKFETVARDLRNARSFSSLLAIPILFGVLAIGPELIRVVYGESYIPATILLVAISGVRVIESQVAPLISALNGLDSPDDVFKMTILATVVNVVVGVPLLVTFGAVGIITGSIAAEGSKLLWCRQALTPLLGEIAPRPRLAASQVVGGVGVFVVARSVVHISADAAAVGVTAAILSGGIVYMAVLFIGSPIARDVMATTRPKIGEYV